MQVSVRALPFKPRVSGDERRSVIERAAARLFAERGYDGTSLLSIAAVAGVSRAVVYDHFSSKRELYTHLVTVEGAELLRQVQEVASEPASDPAEGMSRSIDAFFGWMQEHPLGWRLLFCDSPTDAELAASHRGAHDQATVAIAALLAQAALAQGRPIEPRRAEMLAVALKQATNGLASWWYEHREVPRDQVVAAAMDVCWQGLRALGDGDRWIDRPQTPDERGETR